MSETPTFVKRAKSKTIRTRDGEDENDVPSEPKTVISNFKTRTKRTKPAQRLSFNANDEDESEPGQVDTFQVKKSSLSKKMKFGLPATPGASPGSNLSVRLEQTTLAARSDGPKYDASYLEDLKAFTNSARPAPPPSNDVVHSIDVDSQMMLDASEMDGAIIENMDELPLISSAMNADTMIPSESSIKAARDKRDRLRKTGAPDGAEEDFISLSVAKREEFAPGPHPESRLMREDDDLGEGDDDDAEFTGAQERIALSKKGRKNAEKQRKKGIVELLEEAEEQDEETMEWEMAQVKRAVPTEFEPTTQNSQPRSYKPHPIPTPTPIPALDTAVLRISHALTTFTVSHTRSTDAISALTDDQLKYDVEEAELRRQVDQAEEKRAWFQTFRDRVETVAEFLDEKFPALETLEAEHISLLSERAEMIDKRRMDDNEDDLVLLYGVPADMQDTTDQVDELGRAISSSTAPHSAVRRERRVDRARRHAASDAGTPIAALEEGYATDAALSSADAGDFEVAINTLQKKVQERIFSDVKAKAFRDPKYGIATWFGEWREKWPDIYHNAFGDMGLVQAWVFWARVEVVGWIPLDTPPRLDEFRWYIQLYEYTHPIVGEEEEEEDVRPEDDVAVNMCSTMLIPRLNALIAGGAFDAYSSAQIPHLVDIAEQLEASLGADNVRFSSLLTTVAREFRKSATALTKQYQRMSTSNVYRPTFDPEAIPARQRYMRRVKKLVNNVMKWRRYAKERDGVGTIITGLVGEVLFPMARSGWEVGGEEAVREVARSLPSELIPTNVKAALQ